MKTASPLFYFLVGSASLLGSNPVALAENNFLENAGEIFLKGSINGGDDMPGIIGIKIAIKQTSELLKSAINEDGVRDLLDDIHNDDHDHDFHYRMEGAVENTRTSFPQIITRPWRSLQKIPKAFKVRFDAASKAYDKAGNMATGALAYSGYAALAHLESGYYLLLEAPYSSIAMLAGTLTSVPLLLGWQGLVIASDVGYITLRFAGAMAGIALVNGWSIISSSVGAVATIVIGGSIAIWDGMRWIWNIPHRRAYPIARTLQTSRVETKRAEVMRELIDYLTNYLPKSSQIFDVPVRIEEGDEENRHELRIRDIQSDIIVAVITLGKKKKHVTVQLEFTRKHLKALQERLGLPREQVEALLKEEAKTLLRGFETKLNSM